MTQLWTKLTDVYLPDHAWEGIAKNSPSTLEMQELRVAAFVRWPNGKPCSAINMFLLDKGKKWTGSTATREASKLSHLLKFCFRNNLTFKELEDKDLIKLSSELCEEKTPRMPGTRIRDNNTVRKILSSTITFLFWFQDNLYCGARPIIGERIHHPAITCERRKGSSKYVKEYWWHISFPNETTKDPKLPIAYEMIEDIEAQVEDLYDEDSYKPAAKRRWGIRNSGDNREAQALFEAYREYITARRYFMLWMQRHTGCRLDEMATMPIAANLSSTVAKKPYLDLPTLKRRTNLPPVRKFMLSEAVVREARRYFTARHDWVKVCHGLDATYVEPEAMFLSTEPGNLGAAVAKTGLEKDFAKLAKRAGYTDQQCCFSQFRHLFITERVRHHLRVWQANKGQIQEKDYRTLLEKVRGETGHGDWEALMYYIDLVYEMDGVWEPVTRAFGRIEASRQLTQELRLLRRKMLASDGEKMSGIQVLDLVTEKLEQIIHDAEVSGITRDEIAG